MIFLAIRVPREDEEREMNVLVMFDIKEFGNYNFMEGNKKIDNGFEVIKKLSEGVLVCDTVGSFKRFILGCVVAYYVCVRS